MNTTLNTQRKASACEDIFYAAAPTSLGRVMVGATDRGICFLQFDDSDDKLFTQLVKEYPMATWKPMPTEDLPTFELWISEINDFLAGKTKQLRLPLDIHGTPFQCIVWSYLMEVPYGCLQSYADVARGIGKPSAVRAVASACGNNKIALAIPCHRVVRGDGQLAGFKWGLARKQALIALEKTTCKS